MAGGSLRRMSMSERREALIARLPALAGLMEEARESSSLEALSELMVESPLGFFALPLGVAAGFVIDGQEIDIPLATEEPSVVAAASHAAGLVALGGGFVTASEGDIVTAQVWLEQVGPAGLASLSGGTSSGQNDMADVSKKVQYCDYENTVGTGAAYPLSDPLAARLGSLVNAALPSLVKRGGGYAGADVAVPGDPPGVVRVQIHIRVCDAMGANLANTAAEAAAPLLEEVSGGRALARILTNDSGQRMASASFALPVRCLRRAGIQGAEIARRIELFSRIAGADRTRAVTHNKGIMNGVSALALATGNDTRAVEAAAHLYACKSGRYLPLTTYRLDGDLLRGEISLPVPLGTASSTAALHPGARLSLAVLGNPPAARLGRIAAALGLAQNLAALAALVGEGIQAGHMRLHARRSAFLAGARGAEIESVAGVIAREGQVTLDAARRVLNALRRGGQ